MESENFELNQKLETNINLVDRFEKFEKIKTPEELLSFMKNNIKYGFIGEKDGKIYSPEQEGWGKGGSPAQRLQSPEEILGSGYGICWEQVELEKQWFAKNNFEFKTFLLMFGKDVSQKNPAHTLLAYKKDNNWYWFENTLDSHNGIHKFDSLDDLVGHVKAILINNALNSGSTENDVEKHKVYDYNVPAYGCNTDEFISQVIRNQSGIIKKKAK